MTDLYVLTFKVHMQRCEWLRQEDHDFKGRLHTDSARKRTKCSHVAVIQKIDSSSMIEVAVLLCWDALPFHCFRFCCLWG